MVDILRNAATYEGGLDRGNIMLAARNIHETNPLLIEGLTSIMDGDEGRLPHRGRPDGRATRSPTRRSSARSSQAGDLINLEGELGTYKTVQEAAVASGGATTTTG